VTTPTRDKAVSDNQTKNCCFCGAGATRPANSALPVCGSCAAALADPKLRRMVGIMVTNYRAARSSNLVVPNAAREHLD